MFMLHRACVFDATVRYIWMNAGGKAKRVRPPARIPARCGGGRAFLDVTPPAAGIREGRMWRRWSTARQPGSHPRVPSCVKTPL